MARNIEKVTVATKGNLDIIPIPSPFPRRPANWKNAAPLPYCITLLYTSQDFSSSAEPLLCLDCRAIVPSGVRALGACLGAERVAGLWDKGSLCQVRAVVL